MERTAVLAITKNGLEIAEKILRIYPNFEIFAPEKFQNEKNQFTWYSESTTQKIKELFSNYNALICLFSLGAIIRLIAPYLKDKKTDPAIIAIDDQTTFVISVLSGHLGGANELAREIAEKLDSTPVITTAADVNKTISVDMVGRQFNWKIDDDTNITRISADMVNQEPIGIFQESGNKKWYEELPKNVTIFQSLEELKKSNSKSYLIISEKIIEQEIVQKSVVYRPPNLVVGIGLHWDTTKEKILSSMEKCFEKFELSTKSISKLVSIKKPEDVIGLIEVGKEMQIPVEYVEREELAEITTPNPSNTVKAFEGTASVSEAAAIKISCGKLIVEKQKFPPDLTIAVARIED